MAPYTKPFFFATLAFFLTITTLPLLHALHHDQIDHPTVEAIYQFGDSISDTGNLIRDNPIGEHSNFARLPYGQTFFHKPTGRCSNGRLMIDFFAEYFKLPYLDAYLNKEGNFTHGVNFAVAGSTALSTPTLAAQGIISPITNSSLGVQLQWFKSHLQSTCSTNSSDCKSKLEKALFIIETGGNDFNYAFFQNKTVQDVYKMVPQVIATIKHAVEEVIQHGATQVVIPGNFPIGCMPIYLANFETNDISMYDKLHCLKELNEFAKFQNKILQQTIIQMQINHPKATIIYGDYFSALKGLLQHAASLGFDKHETQKTCCGMGDNAYNFNMTQMCGGNGVSVCPHPHKRVSWDGVHMTQHAYKVMARWLLKYNILPRIINKSA
ncbi:hypothetical protein RDABS01_000763 [Bienertia sinuspersici]